MIPDPRPDEKRKRDPERQEPQRNLHDGEISPRNYEDGPGQPATKVFDPEEQSDPIDQRPD